jgi:hypothetical protein
MAESHQKRMALDLERQQQRNDEDPIIQQKIRQRL